MDNCHDKFFFLSSSLDWINTAVSHKQAVSSGKSLHLSLTTVSKYQNPDLNLDKASKSMIKHYVFYSHLFHVKYFWVVAYKNNQKTPWKLTAVSKLNLPKVQGVFRSSF